ncbi:hypothetical protein [Nocardia yamanashiensis]|nr:hypothetical protein [Nocardia yamanashiensis]
MTNRNPPAWPETRRFAKWMLVLLYGAGLYVVFAVKDLVARVS